MRVVIVGPLTCSRVSTLHLLVILASYITCTCKSYQHCDYNINYIYPDYSKVRFYYNIVYLLCNTLGAINIQ